ncbi:MAG: ERAP1-like C-terminal domain-containing protein, partial [Nocardioides sp.]|nr:ERAP1-like C-terminal domain-containing protein [Nocardioides sp.]
NPGCVTFRDPLVFTSRVTRGVRIQRATTVAHEMAHQWFGNIVTPRWWDDLWLNESFAEYMGNRVTADVTEYDDAWTHNAYARRQWGLVADQRPSTHPVAGNGAEDAGSALQDFDGISYTKGSSILKQLNAALGDEVFFAGAIDHFTRHRFGNATMHDLFASWERAGAGDLSTFTGNWLRTAGPDRIVLDRAAGVVRRTPPAGHPADRAHTFRVARALPEGKWEVAPLAVASAETAYDAGAAAVVLDPYEDSWALVQPDPATVAALKSLLPRTEDTLLRAGIWNNVRSAFHNAALDPADVLDLVEAGLPVEDSDDALFYTMPWVLAKVVPLTADPTAARERVHRAAWAKAQASGAGSPLQLAAFQAAVSSAGSAALLRDWLEGRALPDGVEVDLDLRWRILVRLAVLGETGRAELQAALDAEPTARSRVEHTRAVASLPDPEAKAWAWERFTGRVDVPNYELEAAGVGMWRGEQEELLAPYVDRYFADVAETAQVRSGWVLADAAMWFFPLVFETADTLERARELLGRGDFDLAMRRRVIDLADELERRIAIRAAYPA